MNKRPLFSLLSIKSKVKKQVVTWSTRQQERKDFDYSYPKEEVRNI